MKKILFIAFLFISNFCFSQARELAGYDTTNHRAGFINRDTLQTWQADSPIVITKVSPYKIKLGLSGGFAGGCLTKSTLYPTKLYMGISPNTYNFLGIGTDTPYLQLQILHAVSANTICDTCGILISGTGTASSGNQYYSGIFGQEGYGLSTTGGSKKVGVYSVVEPIQAAAIFPDVDKVWYTKDYAGAKKTLMTLHGTGLAGAAVGSLTLGNININATSNQIDAYKLNMAQGIQIYSASAFNAGTYTIYGNSNGAIINEGANIKKGLAINDYSSALYADSSAMVDISSPINYKGVLIPRYTTNQRDSITGAIYNNPGLSVTNGGSGYTGASGGYDLTGGSGTGAHIYLVISGGVVTGVNYFSGGPKFGQGYKVGDILSATIPGGSGLQITVTRVGIYAANVTKGLMIYNTTMNRINTWDGTQWNYSPQISTGTAAPATTPLAIGDEFVDITNKKIYFATGTSASTDWTITN